MLVCVFSHSLHTRPRVQRAPGIPRSLLGRGFLADLGHIVPREGEAASTISTVVLAKARTHTPRPIDEDAGVRDLPYNSRRGVWVPARRPGRRRMERSESSSKCCC